MGENFITPPCPPLGFERFLDVFYIHLPFPSFTQRNDCIFFPQDGLSHFCSFRRSAFHARIRFCSQLYLDRLNRRLVGRLKLGRHRADKQ